MNIKIRFVVTLYSLLLATTHMIAQKELPKSSAPIPPWDYFGPIPLEKIIPLTVGVVIAAAIALVLFKKEFIDSHGLTLSFWTLMLFGSDVLDTWDVRSITGLINLVHIVVNIFGLVYWIRLGVGDYYKKNTWPSIDILFEIGVLSFMFIVSLIEYILRFILDNKPYFQAYRYYPMVIAFLSMVENYWTKSREVRADLVKSQFIQNVEDAFIDFVGACLEELHSGHIIEFDKKLNDFTRLFSVLVAQRREDWIVAQQIRGLTADG